MDDLITLMLSLPAQPTSGQLLRAMVQADAIGYQRARAEAHDLVQRSEQAVSRMLGLLDSMAVQLARRVES